MKNEEFILRVSETVPDRPGNSSSERTCAECGKQFTVINAELWTYRFDVKGRTSWFCRYNCHRAGEKKHDAKIAENRSRAGRMKELKSKKPSKEVLEGDLRAGLPIAAIAKKHESSIQNVHNWIKSYGLAGIQGQKKDVDKPVSAPKVYEKPILEEMAQASPTPTEIELDELEIAKDQKYYADLKAGYADEMVQESPTLAEIEQFHTDIAIHELPKVEFDPSIADMENEFPPVDGIRMICPTCFLDSDHCKGGHIESEENPQVTGDPFPPIADPIVEETLDDIWRNAEANMMAAQRKYAEHADKEFRDHLLSLVLAVTNGRGI